ICLRVQRGNRYAAAPVRALSTPEARGISPAKQPARSCRDRIGVRLLEPATPDHNDGTDDRDNARTATARAQCTAYEPSPKPSARDRIARHPDQHSCRVTCTTLLDRRLRSGATTNLKGRATVEAVS